MTIQRINQFYIKGWKGLSEHTGYHCRTLQKWHLERARLPIIKLHPNSLSSRWITTPDRVYIWLQALGIKVKAKNSA